MISHQRFSIFFRHLQSRGPQKHRMFPVWWINMVCSSYAGRCFYGFNNGLKLTLAKICQAFIREMYVAMYGNCLVKFGWNISSWGRSSCHIVVVCSALLSLHISLPTTIVQHSVCHIAVPHCKPTNQLGFPTLLQVTTKEDKWGPWCIKRVFSFSVK